MSQSCSGIKKWEFWSSFVTISPSHSTHKKVSFRSKLRTMNFNSVISFLLACSSANSATTRNSNIPSSKSHNATASPVLSSCLECGDGYRLSTCSDTPQSDSDNGTDPFLGLTTNASVSCLLYTEGTNGANITRTCLCEKVTNGTGRGSQKIPGDKKGTLAVDALITVLSFIVFPASVILLCILCRKRHQAETSSTIHPFQHEADSNDVRKQRECVLEILFPPASEGEKVGTLHVGCFLQSLISPTTQVSPLSKPT